MRIIDAISLIEAFVDSDVPVLLRGPSGVGKSDLVRQIAKKRGWYCIDKFRASTIDPVDMRGVPSVSDGRTLWNPPADLPDEARDGSQGFMFFDEINTGTMAVQSAMLQAVLERRIGNYTFPSGVRIIAACNLVQHSRTANRISTALADRFAHIDIEPDMESWAPWAMDNGILPEIVAFLRWSAARDNPLLHKMPDAHSDEPAPTPRSWTMTSRTIEKAPALAFQIAKAKVGEAAAVEFKGFLEVYRDLPKLDDIVDQPTSARVPTEPSQQYAVSAMLAKNACASNFKALVKYLRRLPVEFSVMAVTDAVRRDPGLQQAPGFVDWATSSQAVTL